MVTVFTRWLSPTVMAVLQHKLQIILTERIFEATLEFAKQEVKIRQDVGDLLKLPWSPHLFPNALQVMERF